MKPMRFIVLTVTTLVLAPTIAMSAPQIRSFSGELNVGSEVTLNGTGFGSRSPDFILKDNAESYVFLNRMNRESPVSHNDLWGQQGSNWAKALTPNRSSSLTRGSDNIIYEAVGKAFMGWPRPLSDQSNRSLFVSWWFNPTSDPGASGGSNKFLRVWDAANGEHTRMAWDQMHIVYWRKDIDGSGNIQWGGWNGIVGRWNRIDTWMDADANVIRIDVNGKTAIDVKDFRKSDVSNGLTIGLIGFDPSVASNYESLRFGVDDIYVSDVQSRVEISNSPNWSDPSNTREIQAATKWTDSEVAFELSAGIVDLSKPLYLYIVDRNGEVNQKGFEISSKAPSPIEDLKIE